VSLPSPLLRHLSTHVNIPASLHKYQASKILTIDSTQRHDAGQTRGLKFLQEIEERKNDADFGFLPLLRNQFFEQGPKGKRLCLVQDPPFSEKKSTFDVVGLDEEFLQVGGPLGASSCHLDLTS
jgi:hypothetical protein